MPYRVMITKLKQQLSKEQRSLAVARRYDQQLVIKGKIQGTKHAMRLAERLQKKQSSLNC